LFGGIEGITHEKNDLFVLNLETLEWKALERDVKANKIELFKRNLNSKTNSKINSQRKLSPIKLSQFSRPSSRNKPNMELFSP
jgi:hypothetical protein